MQHSGKAKSADDSLRSAKEPDRATHSQTRFLISAAIADHSRFWFFSKGFRDYSERFLVK